MLSNQSPIVVSTPELLWHGGGNENGKPDPVYSVDYHPLSLEGHGLGGGNILCTSGIDASIPPKGSVRIWRIDPEHDTPEFLLDLTDHQTAVNVARFSPDGRMLASASNRQVVVYVVRDPSMWHRIADVLPLDRTWLRPSLSEDIFDLQWSPDSTHIIIGAIDCKAEILRVTSRDSVLLPGHCSYVQGVAWDPRNEMVATQSADRSCKVHMIKAKPNTLVKLAPRGHIVMKMHGGYQTEGSLEDDKTRALTAADFGININHDNESYEQKTGEHGGVPTAGPIPSTVPSINLYADSFVPSFFRRLSFSPDGALLVSPTGIHRPSSGARKSSPSTTAASKPINQTYCTHIYSRGYLNSPYVSLTGLEDPSIVVRFYDRPYELLRPADSNVSPSISMIPGEYRFVFAVATISSVFVYDTQHVHPIAKFSGLHYATINDLAWSEDGTVLTACSSDGYMSFFRFPPGSLGVKLSNDRVSEMIKRARPCLFDYIPPTCDIATTATESEPVVTKGSIDKTITPIPIPFTSNDSVIMAGNDAPSIINVTDNDSNINTDKAPAMTTEFISENTPSSHNVPEVIVSDISTSPPQEIASTTSTMPSAAEEKKRKRIVPTLIATYTGNSASCALVSTTTATSSDTASEVVLGKIIQANQATMV